MEKPNILYLFADQFRADALGCSGGWVKTPNLDRIAAEGVLFQNAVTNCPLCIPARVSLALGRYPHNNGVWTNFPYTMSPDYKTWYQSIRNAGYRTSMFGKTHLHPHRGDLREREHLLHSYGFDDVDEIAGPQASARSTSHMTKLWEAKGELEAYIADVKKRNSAPTLYAEPSVLPLEDYADVYVGQRAKQYLENYNDEKPWFCHVSFGGPHEPWDAPKPYDGMYSPDSMPKPLKKYQTASPDCPSGTIEQRYAIEEFHVSPEEIARMRANYASNVTLIDDQIGEILKVIEQRGELDNTVILFTSDHGEMNGDHELFYKFNFLNSSVNIPLIVRTPATLAASNGAPRVAGGLVELMDIGPTLAELAGGEIAYEQFAKSLCPLLDNERNEHRNAVFSEYLGDIMMRDKKWKIALNKSAGPYLLFDEENDPEETTNLAGLPEMSAMEHALKMRIADWMVNTQVMRIESTHHQTI